MFYCRNAELELELHVFIIDCKLKGIKELFAEVKCLEIGNLLLS